MRPGRGGGFFRRLGALLLAGLLLSACGSVSGTDPGMPEVKADPNVDRTRMAKELNVYNWSEYLPREVLTQFERLYNLKINYTTYSSNEELISKLQAGGSGYDVIFPSDYAVRVLRREGYLQPLDHAHIPNLRHLEERFRTLPFDPRQEVSVPFMWGTTGIIINTELIQPETVTSWSDLWKPELKGRLVVVDDAREMISMALRTAGHSPNSKDGAQLEAAKSKLVELKRNIKAFNSDNAKDLLLGGEVAAGVVWSGDAAQAIAKEHTFQYIIPSEGLTVWMDNIAIPKGARNKYTAEVFINYLLEPAVSARVSKELMYGNPNAEAQKLLPDFYRENPALNLPTEVWARAQWLDDLGDDGLRLYDRIWTELKG